MSEEFYLNQPRNHECIKLPGKDEKYLLKKNFLNEFFTDEDKAEARSNLGITPLLEELKQFILAKVFDEQGNITFDLEPHEDAFNKVISSAVIYNLLLKYYTKDELDQWREGLIDEINQFKESSKIEIDDSLNKNSENPVQNKAIVAVLDELNNAYLRLSASKLDKDSILNYYNIDEINHLIEELGNSSKEYTDEKADFTNYYNKQEIDTKFNQVNNGIDQLNNDYNSLNNKCNSLHENITQLDSQHNQLNESVNQLNNNVNQLNNDYNQLNEDIGQLNDKVDTLEKNTDYSSDISELLVTIEQQQDIIESLQNKIQTLEQDVEEAKNSEKTKHIFITQQEYDELGVYDKNTLYIIIENEEGSKFGDNFPLILG